MWRPSSRSLTVVSGIALLVALVCSDPMVRGRHDLGVWFLVAVLVGTAAAAVVAWRRNRRRGGWWITAAIMLLLVATAIASLPLRPVADAAWAERHERWAHERLDAAVSHAVARQAALGAFAAAAAAAIPSAAIDEQDPFEICRRWTQRWWSEHGRSPLDSLAMTVWRGGERLGWAGPVMPSLDAAPGDAPDDAPGLFHDDQWWVTQVAAAVPGVDQLTLECQLRLAAVSSLANVSRPAAEPVERTVVRDARSPGRRGWGDAHRGLRVVEDVVLGPAAEHGVQTRLRLTVQVPPRSLQQERSQAQLRTLRSLLLGLAILAWATSGGGAAGFWIAAWLVRSLWARADLTRWLAAVVPAERLPAAPDHPASLLDPAYFATTFGGGWLASGADALLTAVLTAGTVTWLWRRWRPAASDDIPAHGNSGRDRDRDRDRDLSSNSRRRWRLLLVVPVAVGVAVGLARLWLELAANANARLIGLHVPLDAWTFWALHAVILLFSLSGGGIVVLLAVRLWGRMPSGLTGRARPYWLALGLLLVVLFNYTVLSYAYGQAERDWLARRADQIVQPQDDWVSFLLEDVLSEMAAHDTVDDDPAATGGARGALRREAPAYRLWSRSAIRDLGLPCLVEVLDAEGVTTSLYATGFLRDFSYEISARSPWQSLDETGELQAGRRGVVVQDEERFYPTGWERVLRGEIPRGEGRGWLRVELPVQSRRLATVASGLAGVQGVRARGYQPRLEVDRPWLLLRGDRHGWLDVGFRELPSPPAEQAIAALRSGDRDAAVIDLDGNQWLCRWAPLPVDLAMSEGEGFLLGLQQRGAVEVLLDVGRLLLLNALLLGLWLVLTALLRRPRRWQPGFQGRFLLGYLIIGVVLLAVAGSLADRQTFQRIDQEARERTRDGLITALGQLRGLLAEQGRALAGSDYLAELLAGRLAGERPVGPHARRQGMVFGPDGELLLDETLSDLDASEAQTLLAAARQGPLVVVHQPEGLYLGVALPLDLSGVLDAQPATGTFFYRQLIDHQLLPSLAEVVGGEITLRVDGEVVEASHPGRVLSGESPLLASPELMRWIRLHQGQPGLQTRAAGLAFTGGVALPALSFTIDSGLGRRALPAVLAVDFPDRQRDYAAQRREMVLFLAGLITLLLLTALGLAMVMAWNIFEPLRVLLGATRRLAAGDYAAPLPPVGTDEVGRLAEGFGTMRDRLRDAQAVLAARERFLQAVLDQVPVGVIVWDAAGRLAASNPAAADILVRFYPAADSWSERLRRDVAGQLLPDGGELVSDDGRRTLRVGLAPLQLGADAPHRLLVCEDLTEFLAAKKLALNAELACQVAHEIKNPLTPIQLSAQLLMQAYQDRHPKFDRIVVDAVKRILEQVALLRSIAGEFSLLGRAGELECAPLDWPAVVADLASGYQGAGGDGGPEVAIAGEVVPPVLAHRESLLKVLGNLMQNSLDAVGSPAVLRVEVSWRVAPAAVSLLWADNGPGIAADVAGRLFDPYFSTKSRGTGLGLAICRNLLDMMGGTIALTSREDGTGAVATVTLPRADGTQAGRGTAAPGRGDPATRETT